MECKFCFVLFCFVLFCFVLFCFVLFVVLFCFVLFCFVLCFSCILYFSFFFFICNIGPSTQTRIFNDFDDTIDQLMNAYIKQSKPTIMRMMDNILDQDLKRDVEEGSEGQLYTFGIRDMFEIINQTLKASTTVFQLRGLAVSFTANMVVSILQKYVVYQAALISSMIFFFFFFFCGGEEGG